jgi:hypothetical protein
MKSIVLAVLLVSAASGFGQANFAGEYLGVLSSSNTNAPERYLANLFVYPDGTCAVDYWDFDRHLVATGEGTVTAKGRIELVVNNDMVKGMLTKKGDGFLTVDTLSFEQRKIRWSITFTRRFQYPYDPTR